MNTPSREWLEFLREQFPAGSRIQTWELDDPRNTLEEAGKLDYIDDEGRFHVRQSDGGERILALGEEMFSVHPPEPTLLKLYMPMTASFHARNEWGDLDEIGEEWDSRTLLEYEDRILAAMVRNRRPVEAERGLMHWYDKEILDAKVRSAVFTAEARDGRLWGVAECQVIGQLSPEELAEGLSQRPGIRRLGRGPGAAGNPGGRRGVLRPPVADRRLEHPDGGGAVRADAGPGEGYEARNDDDDGGYEPWIRPLRCPCATRTKTSM